MSTVAEGRSVKERPIIFSGPMVNALLVGTKTMTRRVVKPQPDDDGLSLSTASGQWLDTSEREYPRPYGRPGDRLWVRETWCEVDDTEYGGAKWVDYRATPWEDAEHPAGWQNAPDDPNALKWRSPIHMPRALSRITLEVIGVHVERLWEITEEDARKEGVTDGGCLNCGESEPCVCGFPTPNARDGFIHLWDSINGDKPGRAWADNPWVWCIEFQRVGNHD